MPGDSFHSNNSNNKADDHLQDAAQPQLSEVQFREYMHQATVFLASNDGRAAIALLERCYTLHPEDVNVLTNLGGAYILAGKHRYAVPFLERASELAPQNPNVWSNLAAAYLGKLVTSSRAKQDNALNAYQHVIAIDAVYPNVYYNMGLIYVDRRDWDAAYEAFTLALDANPHDQDAENMRRRVEQIRNAAHDPSQN